MVRHNVFSFLQTYNFHTFCVPLHFLALCVTITVTGFRAFTSFNSAKFPKDSSKHWSSVGCEKVNGSDEFTLCHCYHLTSYGLIMDVHNIYVSNTNLSPEGVNCRSKCSVITHFPIKDGTPFCNCAYALCISGWSEKLGFLMNGTYYW